LARTPAGPRAVHGHRDPRDGRDAAARAADLEAAATPAEQTKKPNILVIWGDDIGIWNISCNSRGMMGYRTPIAENHHGAPGGVSGGHCAGPVSLLAFAIRRA
jgi:hypothetical protein